MNRKLLFSLTIIVILIGTLVTVFLVQRQQDLRQRASGADPIALSFTPTQQTVAMNEEFPIVVRANTSGQDVGSVNITFSYGAGLEYVSFAPANPLVRINGGEENTNNRTVRIVLVNATKTPVLGADSTLGTITMRGVSNGTWTVKPEVGVRVTASGINTYVPVSNEATLAGTYTVSTGSATISPNLSPTPSPTGGVGGISPTIATTPGITGDPQLSPTPTIATPSPTIVMSPTPYPTATTFPTPMVDPNATAISFNLMLPGIGSNVSSSGAQLNNTETPQRLTRDVEVRLQASDGTDVTTLASGDDGPVTGRVTFDQSSYSYKGRVDLGDLPSENYIVLVRMDNTLYARLPGFPTITEEQTTNTSALTLVSGDIHDESGDNADTLTISDYNLFLACFRGTPACPVSTMIRADLNDNNEIDIFDLNLLLTGFSTQQGASRN